MASVAMVVVMAMVVELLLFSFFGLFSTFVDDFDVIVEDGGDDGNHIGFDNPGTNGLGTAYTYVDHALKSKVPLPHAHHILAATLLEDADQALDSSIDGENVADASGRGSKVGEMVKRVNEGERRGAVERSTIVQSGGDAHRRLVDVRDAEVHFPHFGLVDSKRGRINTSRCYQFLEFRRQRNEDVRARA